MSKTWLKMLICILLLVISLQYYLKIISDWSRKQDLFTGIRYCDVSRRPVVLLHETEDNQNLPVVETVFTRLGYEMVYFNSDSAIPIWDITWTHFFPFLEHHDVTERLLGQIKPSQKINHFPGIGSVAVKQYFNTFAGGSKYTPKTFLMPREKERFLEYVKENGNEETLWIQKNVQHRGNMVKAIKDLDLDKQLLVQEFVKNQFLLFGHIISIGFHVIITSVVPLRVYVLDSAWLIRICSEPYHPINFTDIRTYVTDGEHMNSILFDFAPMKGYFDIDYSRKQALHAHIVSVLGKNPDKIDEQLKDAIQDALVRRQALLGRNVPSITNELDSNFFEVMRWDFLLDDELNVHLIEANMSPDIVANEVLIRRKNEHLLYSSINTLGYQRGSWSKHSLRDADIYVDLKVCYSTMCEDCKKRECRLCSQCLSKEQVEMLRVSHAEHMNRQGLRRVYPPPMTQSDAASYNASIDEHLSQPDQINKAWFRAKCIEDINWCS